MGLVSRRTLEGGAPCGLACSDVGSHGFERHWHVVPWSCVVSRCWCVSRWGYTFRRDQNSSLHVFVSEDQPADGRAGLGSGKPVSGMHGKGKGCACLLGPGLLVH